MLASRILELRTERKMTQRDVASLVNLSQQAIAKWEKGSTEPDSASISILADFFDVSIDYLLGRNGSKKTPTVIDDGLAEDERQFIENYRLLNAEGQEKLLDASDDLVQSGKYKKRDEDRVVREA